MDKPAKSAASKSAKPKKHAEPKSLPITSDKLIDKKAKRRKELTERLELLILQRRAQNMQLRCAMEINAYGKQYRVHGPEEGATDKDIDDLWERRDYTEKRIERTAAELRKLMGKKTA